MSVSVVIRTYDRPDSLARAIADVRAQLFADWSIVVVNDGGDPVAVERVVEAATDGSSQPVAVVHLESNGGRWVAANAGARLTEATYLSLHDDDDSWDPEFLRSTVHWLQDHPEEDVVAAATDILIEDGHGVEHRHPFCVGPSEVTLYDLVLTNRLVPIGVLYRYATLADLGFFDQSLQVVGDWEYHLRLASRRPIQVLSGEPLAFWHQRPDEVGNAGNSVITMHDEHRRADKLIRDRALRELADQGGLGSVLYLARFIDEQNAKVIERIQALEGGLDAATRRELELRGEAQAMRSSWSFRIGQILVSPVVFGVEIVRSLSHRRAGKRDAG